MAKPSSSPTPLDPTSALKSAHADLNGNLVNKDESSSNKPSFQHRSKPDRTQKPKLDHEHLDLHMVVPREKQPQRKRGTRGSPLNRWLFAPNAARYHVTRTLATFVTKRTKTKTKRNKTVSLSANNLGAESSENTQQDASTCACGKPREDKRRRRKKQEGRREKEARENRREENNEEASQFRKPQFEGQSQKSLRQKEQPKNNPERKREEHTVSCANSTTFNVLRRRFRPYLQ